MDNVNKYLALKETSLIYWTFKNWNDENGLNYVVRFWETISKHRKSDILWHFNCNDNFTLFRQIRNFVENEINDSLTTTD